jgi:hypothetical protein
MSPRVIVGNSGFPVGSQGVYSDHHVRSPRAKTGVDHALGFDPLPLLPESKTCGLGTGDLGPSMKRKSQ